MRPESQVKPEPPSRIDAGSQPDEASQHNEVSQSVKTGQPEAAQETKAKRQSEAAGQTEGVSPTNRREFIAWAGHATVVISGLTAVAGAVRMVVPSFDDATDKRFPLGRADEFKMNTITWLRDRDLFVMRNEAGVGAFSSKCTHLGCTVRRTSEGFLCPCHGATYDHLGAVVTGPATRPLPWFEARLHRDGLLWVSTDRPMDEPSLNPITLPHKDLP